MGVSMWIRHVLVPERNDRDDYLHRLADFIATLKTVERVEVLPYHTLGTFKWENLHIDYPLKGINPPTKERIENAEKSWEQVHSNKKPYLCRKTDIDMVFLMFIPVLYF